MLEGNSAVKVAEKYGDAPRTVAKWVERFRESGASGLEDAQRPGRPSSLSPAHENKLRRFVAAEHGESRPMSGGIIARFLKERLGVSLTRRQCERILKRLRDDLIK